MSIPEFKYHPDPIATGSIVKSEATCRCCNQARGFIYAGPVYAEEKLDQAICPWCIADGSAAARFDAVYVDPESIGGAETEVPESVRDELGRRTPGFAGWQQERWLACCNDAAAFLGPCGRLELEEVGEQATKAVRVEAGLKGSEWEQYLAALHRDKGPTAYLFRCLHCGNLLAYSDSH